MTVIVKIVEASAPKASVTVTLTSYTPVLAVVVDPEIRPVLVSIDIPSGRGSPVPIAKVRGSLPPLADAAVFSVSTMA